MAFVCNELIADIWIMQFIFTKCSNLNRTITSLQSMVVMIIHACIENVFYVKLPNENSGKIYNSQ